MDKEKERIGYLYALARLTNYSNKDLAKKLSNITEDESKIFKNIRDKISYPGEVIISKDDNQEIIEKTNIVKSKSKI